MIYDIIFIILFWFAFGVFLHWLDCKYYNKNKKEE